jgi:hypothetical protein
MARYKKVLSLGRWVSKISKKVLYGRPHTPWWRLKADETKKKGCYRKQGHIRWLWPPIKLEHQESGQMAASKKRLNPRFFFFFIHPRIKVIHTKYSKHWPYTVAHTIDCVCSEMLNHGLHISLFKLKPCHIHWIVYVIAYSDFIFEFESSFSTTQNGPLCPDT